MKKAYLYLTLTVAAVLACACAKTTWVDGPEGGEAEESRIGFGSVTAKRAGEVTPDASKPLQIQVYDYFTPAAEGSAETEYIDELIQESETEGVWAFVKEGKKNSYSWKRGGHIFFGWVATDETGNAVPGLSYSAKTLTVAETELPGTANTDYRYALVSTVTWPDESLYVTDDNGKKTDVKPVSLTVRHLASALTYSLKNNTDNTDALIAVSSVQIGGVATKGSAVIDYSAETPAPAITLDGTTGSVTLKSDAKTCVWPQTVSGAEITVSYTENGGAAQTLTASIPDAVWEAGKVYNFSIEVVDKGLELTFTVLPWQEVEVGAIDTATGSINMSNVTWMNSKVTVDGVEKNTVDNSAYSVYMYYQPTVGGVTYTANNGYFPAQGYFTVNYPSSGLYRIGLIPAYGETEVEEDMYEIYIYDYDIDTATSWVKQNEEGETITNNTVYFQVRAASGQDGAQHKAQVDIWFKPSDSDEWISAYSEVRANYALIIPATN